jgi:hypothetical protein
MLALGTGRTRRAGRKCVASMRSRCGRQTAGPGRPGSSHDSCWEMEMGRMAMTVEHQSRRESWPSESRWRALSNQARGRASGKRKARMTAGGDDGEDGPVWNTSVCSRAGKVMHARAGGACTRTLWIPWAAARQRAGQARPW